jgi:hypothetical protein
MTRVEFVKVLGRWAQRLQLRLHGDGPLVGLPVAVEETLDLVDMTSAAPPPGRPFFGLMTNDLLRSLQNLPLSALVRISRVLSLRDHVGYHRSSPRTADGSRQP